MPNLPISQLPAAGLLTGTELFATVQGGVTKYTTLNSMTYVQGNNYGLFNQTGSSTPVTGIAPFSGSLIDGGIGTLSVPANGFQKGDAFQATLSGIISADNNKTLEIKIESNGTILVDTGAITMPKITAKRWRMDIDFSINNIGGAGVAAIATAGTITFRTDSSGDVVTEIFSNINNTTFDTTINNTLAINAIWGNSPSSADSIYSILFSLLKVY
jgi:predicted secreted protein